MTREEFANVADETFDSLPGEFRSRIQNVAILVEDYPPKQSPSPASYRMAINPDEDVLDSFDIHARCFLFQRFHCGPRFPKHSFMPCGYISVNRQFVNFNPLAVRRHTLSKGDERLTRGPLYLFPLPGQLPKVHASTVLSTFWSQSNLELWWGLRGACTGRQAPHPFEHERQSAMHSVNGPALLRRSSRVPTAVQILVTSLDGKHFSDVCETLVVNAHGCAIMTRVKLEAGVPLHLHSKEGRDTTARVVSCQPIDSDHRSWILAATLDHPENFWGLRDCPKDWALPAAVVPTQFPQIVKVPKTPGSHDLPGQVSQASEAMLERAARQLEAQMKRMIIELVRPLQAEVLALKERLSQREANPSRFEVSLSNIPPELEQQIESRVRGDLGPRLLEEARVQSLHLLASAKAMIDQQTSGAYENFHRMVAEELHVVEKRAQDISAYISENTQENLRGALEEFHQKLLDGGNSLKRLSEELLEFLQQNLNAEHDARRTDLEQLRAAVASESARLQDQIGYLDTRIGKLDQSARCLESGMDQRLSRISSDTVRDTRMQFESAANEIMEELTARSVHLLRGQLAETSETMKSIQEGIVASASESFKGQAGNALRAFEGSMEHLARFSVERWRLKLEGGLNALAKSLNEQFRLETGAGECEK